MHRTLTRTLTAAVVAGTLAACSTDQHTQTTATPPPPVVAPATPTPHPAPVPLTIPRPAEKPVAKAASGQGSAASASKPKRWVSRAAQPVVEPAANRVGCDLSEVLQAYAELTVARDSAAAIDLPTFCAQAAPGVQVYQVRPGRDTVLLGQQGTRLVVPARAFDVPAGSGPVRLELREFYTTADIVLAGLGTRAGQDVLETGGMLHLYAAANGQTVHLRPGMQLLVQVPTQQQLPGMRLYEGVSADASHAPDWQLPGTGSLSAGIQPGSPTTDRAAVQEWVKLHPPKSPRWPDFAKGRKTLLSEMDRLLPNNKADQAYLRRKHTVSKEEQQMLKELSRLNHTPIRHAVAIEVLLDSTGALQQTTQVTGDSTLGVKVLAALRQLPAQRPASFISRQPHQGRTASAAWGEFSVLYTRSGKQLVGFSWWLLDKQLREELAIEAQRSRAQFARQFASTSTPLTLSSGLYYELAAGGLGWINCDRLWKAGPRTLFTVNTPDPGTVVSLVFKGQRSILASSRTEGSAAVFEQVPEGAAATVVALRREAGITYLATSSVSLSQAAQPVLEFRPVSLAELRTQLAQL